MNGDGGGHDDRGARDWIARALPPVPGPFADRLRGVTPGGVTRPGTDDLMSTAMGAMARSLAPEASALEHRGAFELLAADALFTYAAENVLDDEGDPVDPLRAMAAVIGTGQTSLPEDPDGVREGDSWALPPDTPTTPG